MHFYFLSMYNSSFSEEKERKLLTPRRTTNIVACHISVCTSSLKPKLTLGALYNWKNCIRIMVLG